MIPAPARRPMGLRPLLATLGYGVLVLALLAIAANALLDLMARRAAVDEAATTLEQLERRRLGLGRPAGNGTAPSGSPFLEGPSVTIAGAALMQRLSAAVSDADGHITSSRVEVQGTPYGPGFLAVSASLDIAQGHLQKLLYDLESGLPFLFVGQLAVRPAHGSGDDRQGLQVALTVYGQWRGAP